jgi:GH25 family lysozyme M1 (1,4-beta-N-acetylmuramidase)
MGGQYVDISSNNGTPNLAAYRDAGHADLMLKATEGTGYAWPQMQALARQWHSFGSQYRVGYYHWLYGTLSAASQHTVFWQQVAPVWRAGDWTMTDFEDVDPSRWVSDAQHLAVLRDFDTLCQAHGYHDIYTGNWYLANLPQCVAYLRTRPVVMSDYSNSPPANPHGLTYDAHQFTNSASVPGFAGRVDYNRWLADTGLGGGAPLTPEADMTPEESAQLKEMYGILHNFVAGTGRQTLDSYFNAGGTGQTRISQAVADEFAAARANGRLDMLEQDNKAVAPVLAAIAAKPVGGQVDVASLAASLASQLGPELSHELITALAAKLGA